MMQNTELLVGMHGAALTNMFFMPSNSTVVEFRYNGPHHNHCYWHLSSACQINYMAFFGISDDTNKILEGQGCNLTIPIQLLEKTIQSII